MNYIIFVIILIQIILRVYFYPQFIPCKMGAGAGTTTCKCETCGHKMKVPITFDIPNDKFSKAAERIYNACKGAGTNEGEIILVITSLKPEERVKVPAAFEKIYSKNMIDVLKKDLSGNFQDVVVELFSGARFTKWAEYIHKCIKGAGTDEKRLLPLVFLMSDEEQPKVAAEFQRLYKTDMVEMIEKDIGNGDWINLLRDGSNPRTTVLPMLKVLLMKSFEASKGAGTDEETFMIVLCKCNTKLYGDVCKAFATKYNKTIGTFIEKEMSGKNEHAFLLAHFALLDKKQAVAYQLSKAIKGAGTDDKNLVNLTTLFADTECRAGVLQQAYSQFGDITKDIKGDLTGNYEKIVLALGLVIPFSVYSNSLSLIKINFIDSIFPNSTKSPKYIFTLIYKYQSFILN
uniref:Annexin 5 n=1 Tax=Spironucleus barkhanus TaxID=103874 RepID=A0A142C657_SPIBA|nr:annexin 5 [Spironucleus barkhanus]